jgi:hypothetical protein
MAMARWASSLYDHRRVANRKGWRPPEPEDPDVWTVPNERLGKTYALNWSLNGLSITPRGDAYRNLFPRGLQFLSRETLDSNRATVVRGGSGGVKVFSLSGKEGAALGLDDFKQLFRNMRMYFSDIDNLFVNDGTFSSSPSSSVTARFVSNRPEVSLYLHHHLPRARLGNAFEWTHQFTVYICDGLKFDSELAKKLGDGPFAAVDSDKGNVLFHNVTDFSAIQDTLASVYAANLSKTSTEHDVLRCDARLVNGSVALVFDEAGKGPGYGSQLNELYGARHIVVSNNGIARLWNGLTSASSFVPATRGDIVSQLSDSTLRTTSIPQKGNQAPLPNSLFILSSAKGAKVSALEPAKAAQLVREKFLVGGSGAAVEAALRGVTSCTIVPTGGLKEEEVNKLLQNSSDGSSPRSKKN